MRRHWIMLMAMMGFLVVWSLPAGALAQMEGEGENGETEEPAGDLDEEASTPEGIQQVTERLAQTFNVETDAVSALREEGLGFGEIHHALSLAEQLPGGATQENIDEVMSLREEGMGWGQISHEYDTTLGEVTRRGGSETTSDSGSTTDSGELEAESLVRPGRSSDAGSRGRGTGGGVAASGVERPGGGGHGAHGSPSGQSHGGGLGHGAGGIGSSSSGGGFHGGGIGSGGGGGVGHGGKSSSAPGRNR